jgi:hypothetical protein
MMRALRYFTRTGLIEKYWLYCPCCGYGYGIKQFRGKAATRGKGYGNWRRKNAG